MGSVTRIIAGFAGSLVLTVPKAGTRPTSDRVREAIFSALDSRDLIDGARVVDLYAGSGALGLEAASRGATSVSLVENGAAAIAACRRNVTAVLRNAPRNNPPSIDVTTQPVQAFLTGAMAEWDIAFLDPPYELRLPELAATLEALSPRLAPDAVVVIERSSRDPEPTWPQGLQLDRRKDYGDTTLWWARSTRPA
ncbi:16S rRNA (guanine(966)-N(2))-methyltransferase RsmD [soil metagenome]